MEAKFKSYFKEDSEKIPLFKQKIAIMSNSSIEDIGNIQEKALETPKYSEEILEQILTDRKSSEIVAQIAAAEELSINNRKLEVKDEFKENQISKNFLGKVYAMDLCAKIKYFQPIMHTTCELWTIDTCIEDIREILLSNDGQYLFVCISYLDWKDSKN